MGLSERDSACTISYGLKRGSSRLGMLGSVGRLGKLGMVGREGRSGMRGRGGMLGMLGVGKRGALKEALRRGSSSCTK